MDIKNKDIENLGSRGRESCQKTGKDLNIDNEKTKGTLASFGRERKPSSAEWQRILETLRKLKLSIDI